MMKLRTLIRDCLFLNWVLPLELLPPSPPPLRYQIQSCGDGDFVFVSALLFRQEGLRIQQSPTVGLSHPQYNFRLCVLDREGVPSVLFANMLVPVWVVMAARWIARQPARVARFSFPFPSRHPDVESWQWRVERQARLQIRASRGVPAVSPGNGSPAFFSWQATVDYIRQRPRGYYLSPQGLRRIDTSHPSVDVWPLRVEIEEMELVQQSLLPLAPGLAWPPLHSSWLCPEIPMVFELVREPRVRLSSEVPSAGLGEVAGQCRADFESKTVPGSLPQVRF